MIHLYIYHFFFFFNDTATTEIYTLSLHDALPISRVEAASGTETAPISAIPQPERDSKRCPSNSSETRSEEHTSELQSRLHLVCRLLLEKKKKVEELKSQRDVAYVRTEA